jgi:hypothetical protein
LLILPAVVLGWSGLPGRAQGKEASTVVTNASQEALEAALASGVPVTLAFDGTVALTNAILVTSNATLDASGRHVTLDGQNGVRHFVVTNGATLRLINLTLANGRLVGIPGQTNQNGEAACGGSIYNTGGVLELIACTLTNNHAIGGQGGPTAVPSPPPGFPDIVLPTKGGSAFGGAIYSEGGEIRMTNCVVAGNASVGGVGMRGKYVPGGQDYDTGIGADAFGGAIYSTDGIISLTGVRFTDNAARTGDTNSLSRAGSTSGGAIYEAGVLVVNECAFLRNRALCSTNYSGGGGARGGAIRQASGTAVISRTLFAENRATGGYTAYDAPAVVSPGLASGGAISSSGEILELRDSAFVLNEANGGDDWLGCSALSWAGSASGGAISSAAQLTAINCTFAQNKATGGDSSCGWGGSAYGGAISSYGATNLLVNVTLADNAVQLHHVSPLLGPPAWRLLELALGSSLDASKSTTLVNTILSCAAGQTNIFFYSSEGAPTDGGHNLCSDSSAAFTSPTSRGNLDPRLAPLADNGGPTPTMALLPDSPAIDAGDDSACPPADQRGVRRPQGLACDIGAYELAPQLALSSAGSGQVAVRYAFKAHQTNSVSASTNLANWLPLGTSVSDSNGVFQIEEVDPIQVPLRFYRVEISAGQR